MSPSEYSKIYYLKNKERINKRVRENYLANRDKILARMREHHILNRARHILSTKRGHYKRKFGLTLEERDIILARGCQICKLKATHIDHDHLTGKVRGGLCNNCNTGLGMFQDSQGLLIEALNYISRH